MPLCGRRRCSLQDGKEGKMKCRMEGRHDFDLQDHGRHDDFDGQY